MGLKPTRGLVAFGPEQGSQYFGTTVDGVLTRSVRDAAAMLDVLVGPRDSSMAWSPSSACLCEDDVRVDCRPLRISVTTTPPLGLVEDECAEATRMVGGVLEQLGHQVEEDTPNWGIMMAVAGGPMSVPSPAGLVGPEMIGSVEPRNRGMIQSLANLTVVEHAARVGQVQALSRKFLSFWDRYDVVVTPTAGIIAPPVTWAPWDQTPEEYGHVRVLPEFCPAV